MIDKEQFFLPSHRLIAGNWKMNHNHLEAIQVTRKICLRLIERGELSNRSVSIHPSFIALRSVQTVLESEGSSVLLGAQNCFYEPQGAFTGEVSATMLSKLNVSLVIVGHSERRTLFGEDDQLVLLKAKSVVANNMIPIICVGESSQERNDGSYKEFVTKQVISIVEAAPKELLSNLIIAYEPIWAIGTGISASLDQAVEACELIKEATTRAVGATKEFNLKVLYGGSVNTNNATDLLSHESVGGFLVGGASLDPDSFVEIVSSVR